MPKKSLAEEAAAQAAKTHKLKEPLAELFRPPSRSIQRDLGAFSAQLAVSWSIVCQMEP